MQTHTRHASIGRMKVAGLFAGIGGFELGLAESGHHAELLCDILPTSQAVLKDRFPRAEIVSDIVHLSALAADIVSFGGQVDKIVGDGILALFGAPIAHEDDAERGVRAVLKMQETVRSFDQVLGVPIRMRIGVNTGEALVGALRADGEYTATGDAVNTASRLQVAAEPGGVLVGASIGQRLSESLEMEGLHAQRAHFYRERFEAGDTLLIVRMPPDEQQMVIDLLKESRAAEAEHF